MDAQKVDMFLMVNGKFFESHQVATIREKLLEMEEPKWLTLQAIPFKDPTIGG